MSEPVSLERALLVELDDQFHDPKSGGKRVKVQFNPESLKVAFANQLQEPQGQTDQRGPSTRQYVGSSTTKLSLQLWFDVTAPMPEGEQSRIDVRQLTAEVAYFITPQPRQVQERGRSRQVKIPPPLRFLWGTFQFDGTLDSLDESLEYWSEDGRPLRASLSLAMSQQTIQFQFDQDALRAREQAAAQGAAGTRPLTPAPAGATVQGMAGQAAPGRDWQSVAAANGIENPRLLAPGQLLYLGAGAGASASLGTA